MSVIYFISDLHLQHEKVITFEDNFRAKCMGVKNISEHDSMLYNNIIHRIKKRDILYLLGDLGWETGVMHLLKNIQCEIRFILGNHDNHKAIPLYASLPNVTIYPPHKYKGYWVTHIPMHPSELYGKKNIHGHIHSKSLKDENYINVSVEMTEGKLINFENIKGGRFTTHDR